MLQNWLILMPEILMLLYLFTAMSVNKYRTEKTPQTFFTLLRWFLLAILLATLIFYNKSAYPDFWQNTPFTTLFKSCSYLLLLAWNYLSSKWFLNKNRHSYKFCSLLIINLLGLNFLASSTSLLTLCIASSIICWANRHLIYRHWDITKVAFVARLYSCSAVFFITAALAASLWLYYQTGSFTYTQISSYLLSQAQFTLINKFCAVALICLLMFLTAATPFHLWFINFIRNGVLPISGFITLVPWFIYLCSLINLLRFCLAPMSEFIMPIITAFGIISVLFGAFSAMVEKNIRCLFAYISIYCIGFNFTGLIDFSYTSVISSFAYSIVCLLSLGGVYTVFLGLKSHGEYLSEIEELNGFYETRPYMSAALLVFVFSLIGAAPTLGFFGYLSILHNLAVNAGWWRINLLLISTLFTSAAIYRVIKSVYFTTNTQKYDRPDKSIYICLFINMLIILISLFFPTWLMHDALVVLGGTN